MVLTEIEEEQKKYILTDDSVSALNFMENAWNVDTAENLTLKSKNWENWSEKKVTAAAALHQNFNRDYWLCVYASVRISVRTRLKMKYEFERSQKKRDLHFFLFLLCSP